MKRLFFNGAAVASLGALAALAALSVDLSDAKLTGAAILALAAALAFWRGKSANLAMMAFTGYVMARYFAWRAESFPTGNGWIALGAAAMLFASELYTMAIVLMGYFVSARPLEREAPALPADPSLLPMVDVYIPTYSEPLSVIAPTVMGALEMEYPKERFRVYVLDDGFPRAKSAKTPEAGAELLARAEDLKKLCARHGAHYLTRSSNEHAKSGNLNVALTNTSGELIAILDADHIPSSDFLKNTVGFFLQDAKAALVQTPHFFTNADPVEKNLGLFNQMPAENDLFYRVIQKGLDLWNTSFFCGSGAVVRRSAIEGLGGFSTDSITEDASTSVKLHQRGWRTVYYGRPMVAGLQPETFSGFLVQRLRWGTGMLQILIKQNPWLVPGLSFGQRVCYTSTAAFWLFPFARVVAFSAPLLSIFFNLRIYPGGADAFVGFTLPFLAATILTAERTTGRFRRIFASELYETLQALYMLPALISTMMRPSSPTFKVTPKGEKSDRDYISEFRMPFYVCMALTFAGVLWGLKRMVAEPEARAYMLLAVCWLTLNLFMMMGALGTLFERAQRRSRPRVDINEQVELIGENGERMAAEALDANELGLRVRVPEGVELTRFALLRGGVEIPARALPRGKHSKAGEHPALYEFATPEQERAAVSFAFGDSERWVALWSRRESPSNFVKSLFGMLALSARGANAHLRHAQSQNRSQRGVMALRAALCLAMLAVGLPAEGQTISRPLSAIQASEAACGGSPCASAFSFELAPREMLSGAHVNLSRPRALSAQEAAGSRYIVWVNGDVAGQYAAEPGEKQSIPVYPGAFAPGVNTMQVALAPKSMAPMAALAQKKDAGADLSASKLALDFSGQRPNPAPTLDQLPLAFDRRAALPRQITVFAPGGGGDKPQETLRSAAIAMQALALRLGKASVKTAYVEDVSPDSRVSAAGGLKVPAWAMRAGDVVLVGQRSALRGFLPEAELNRAAGPSLGLWSGLDGRSAILVVTGKSDADVRAAALALAGSGLSLPAAHGMVQIRPAIASAASERPLRGASRRLFDAISTTVAGIWGSRGELAQEARESQPAASGESAASYSIGLAGDDIDLENAALNYAVFLARREGRVSDVSFGFAPNPGSDRFIFGAESGLGMNVRAALPGYPSPSFGGAAELPFGAAGAGRAIIGHDALSVRRSVDKLREDGAWAAHMAGPARFASFGRSMGPLATQPRSWSDKARGWLANPVAYWALFAACLAFALWTTGRALSLQEERRKAAR